MSRLPAGIVIGLTAGARDFSLPRNVQTNSGALPVPYAVSALHGFNEYKKSGTLN